MNKTTKLLAVLLAVVLSAAIIVLLTTDTEAAAEVTLSAGIEERYSYGDEFEAPACVFVIGDTRIDAEASLQYPDGTRSFDKTNTLDQSGKYVLRYFAKAGEKTYTKEYEFLVKGRLVTYNSAKTSAEYGLCTHLGADSEGLMLRIANGDAVTFGHVFDMTKVDSAVKLAEGFVVPDTQGTADFSKLVFTFTDIEDPSVKLIYNANFNNDENAYGITFFTAGANTQVQCGLEYAGKLHVGGTLGCLVPHSFVAMNTGTYWGAEKPTPTTPDDKLFSIGYDYAANQAWAGGKIISDLDDSYYYDTLWLGFPSGKAKLTVSALNYSSSTANVCLTSVYGVDLSASEVADEEPPVITIDNEYETMPDAKVGKTYPVPQAKAFDTVSGECRVNVGVWFNYGSDHPVLLDVEEGRFATAQVGTYAIVYEAEDANGNVAKEVLWIRARQAQYMPKLTVSVPQDAETEVKIGTLYRLPTPTVEGGSGNCTVSVSVARGNDVCEVENNAFRLEKTGEWTVTFVATDYIGEQAICIYAITAQPNEVPVLKETPTFPAAFISSCTYVLPEIYAYDYSGESVVQRLCDVTVDVKGTKDTYRSGGTFVPVAEDGDKITLSYLCKNQVLYSAEVPVRVVWTKEKISGTSDRTRDAVNVDRYFYTEDNVSLINKYATGNLEGLLISVGEASERVSLGFINAQSAQSFSLDLATVPGRSVFSAVKLVLRDSADASVSVTATLRKADGQTRLTIGNTNLFMPFDYDSSEAVLYSLGFAKDSFVINNSTKVAVALCDSGEPFKGFPSGKLYFGIEIEQPETNTALFVHKICGILAANTQDNTGPDISVNGNYGGTFGLGDTCVLPSAYACDMLSPTSSATVSVFMPSGEMMTSADGVLLSEVDAGVEYTLKLTEYGEYIVRIEGKETDWQKSNKTYFEYLIRVVDMEKPVLTFTGEFQSKVALGDYVYIPDYIVSDNYSATDKIVILKMITNPRGMPVMLYDDVNAVKSEYVGVYRIEIFVYDEMGNMTHVAGQVEVE